MDRNAPESGRPNWPLLALALFMAPVALQASLFPNWFFDSFPVGRGWVAAAGGAYNEHLTRDVGVLFLALVIAAAWTAKTRAGDRALAAAWLIQGLAHFGFHTAHLRELDTLDQVGLLLSLAAVPLLAAIAMRFPARRLATTGVETSVR